MPIKEPTLEMIAEGMRVLAGAPEMSAGELVIEIWKAMEAARPKEAQD